MDFMSLYQKYRPKCFSDIVGQEYVVQTLINSIKLNHVCHAYIFSGPKGVGKTTIAKLFSKAINCKFFSFDICGKCESCLKISQNNTLDIYELDAASNSSVEDVRKILENVNYIPSEMKYKVYIIDEAHMLSINAWNAFLKTIEDPPKYAVFIFATTEIQKIPSTIISRCQSFDFSLITDSQIRGMLIKVCEKEKINITNDALDLLSFLSEGSARDSLSFLEQLQLYTNNTIDVNSINKMFGLIDIRNKLSFLNKIFYKKFDEVFIDIEDFRNRGINFSKLLFDIINIFLDKLIYLKTNDSNLLKILSRLNVDSVPFCEDWLLKAINIAQKIYADIKNSSDPYFNFRFFIVSIINLNKQNSSNDVSHTIKENKNKKTFEISPDGLIDMDKKSFDISSIVDIKEIKFEKNAKLGTNEVNFSNNTEQKKVAFDKTSLSLSLDDIFISIIKNANKDLTNSAMKIFSSLKELCDLNEHISYLSNAISVAFACETGMIVVFNDQLDADYLNENFTNVYFLKEIEKLFNKPFYIVGGTKQLIKKNIEKAKKDNKKYSVPDIKILEKIKENPDPINLAAMEIFKG